VSCETNPVIEFRVANNSTASISSFQITRSINGSTPATQDFNNTFIDIGEEKTYSLNGNPLTSGENTITLTVSNPNGLPDTQPSNDALTFTSILDNSSDQAPLRQNFDDPTQVPWIIASPKVNALPWESVDTNKKQSAAYKAFTNSSLNEESWLVSPVLDLSRYGQNTLLFDLGYAQNAPEEDHLKILGSTDCGQTYPIVLFDRAGSEFSVTNSSTNWTPATDADWKREHVSLDSLSGRTNIRLAIVATNGHGNNLYVDNLEIFAGDDANPPTTTLPYQLYYSNINIQSDVAITFNLPQRTDVRIQIHSLMGQIIADNIFPETLNQTYYFDLSIQATGLYLFRVFTGSEVTTTKVFIAH
jgi:hypothetical protein